MEIRVEKHVINEHHEYFDECKHLTWLSKNLYNATLYCVRQQFIFNKKYISYYEINKKFTHRNQHDYRQLPSKVSQTIQRLVDKNMQSFFSLLKLRKDKGYDKPIKLPNYLKSDRSQVVHYDKQALSFKRKKGFIHLSKTNIFIKTKQNVDNIRYVKIVPKGNHFLIIVGYSVKEIELLEDNSRYGSIDLGLNNLITFSSNVTKPFIINGKPIKSINQYYNKQVSKFKSKLPNNKRTSKHINNLYKRRSHKIDDYFHKVSSKLVNHLVSNRINTLVIGYNKGWKQDIKIGKRNNQNFVQVPFQRLINMLIYKCNKQGISVVLQEESYTSKCSFLDNESIKKHNRYEGRRVKRGLFKIKNGNIINADLNGSLNILKKYLIKQEVWNEDLFSDCIEVCSIPTLKKYTISF